MTEEIVGHISSKEPDLTDHSATHLAEVMTRANSLIGEAKDYFTPYELYLLCVSILFHDVGNLHGRQEHQKKIATIYDSCRRRENRFRTERTAVLAIAGAHTGSTKDGSKDTLREVNRLSFQGQPVRGPDVAAMLRLADELAEGPQRTSAYVLNNGGYKPESHIFHKYASVADYCITGDRLALSYNIDIENGPTGLEIGNNIPLGSFLEFCYHRIGKVDEERRYCKHYCDLLSRLKKTGAWFEFWFNGLKLDLDIEPIEISDLLVPGEHPKNIVQIDARYEPSKLLSAIAAACPTVV